MFFVKLAFGNLKKSYQDYFPFFLSSLTLFVLLNTINLIWLSPDIQAKRITPVLLQFAFWVTAIFAVIIIVYSHRFLMKQRSKEFGLYNVLGMNRSRIGRIAVLEIGIVGITVVLAGVLLATILSKFLYLILVNLLQMSGFYLPIHFQGYGLSIGIFLLIYSCLMAFTWWSIKRLSSLSLLSTARIGEKTPKGNLFLGMTGILLVIGAYAFAVYDKLEFNSDYLTLTFIAVMAVILGTYLFFVSFTTWFLRKQKENKTYFYKQNHFIPTSQMLYRMKQNAFGLANIAILSTMVLITLISTTTLYFMIFDAVEQQYPGDKNTFVRYFKAEDRETVETNFRQVLEASDLSDVDYSMVWYLGFYDSVTNTEQARINDGKGLLQEIIVIPEEEFQRLSGEHLPLENGEIGYYNSRYANNSNAKTLSIGEELPYTIKPLSKHLITALRKQFYLDLSGYAYLVVKDEEELKHFAKAYDKHYSSISASDEAAYLDYTIGLQLDNQQYERLKDKFSNNSNHQYLSITNNKDEMIKDNLSFTGTFLFIGFIIGMSFLLGACLIMYFKQISEGHEDKKAYKVLQEIGMSPKMVKKAISSQVWFVFFMPLLVGVCHVVFGLLIVVRFIDAMGIRNDLIMYKTAGLVMVAFVLIYFLIYRLTSRTYYKIIER